MSNTVPLPPATEMQQAILQHHGAAFADFPAQPAPAPESDEPVYRGDYGKTAARSRRLANAMRGLGVHAGDRVATLACSEWVRPA